MTKALIKFSSEDCGVCHKMYRQILMAQYPDKKDMGWPTYLVCESPEGDFEIVGEVKGGHPKGEFRSRLQAILQG